MQQLSKGSGTPMYEQIAEILKDEIMDKKYDPSGSIGTHAKLAERFGVSLITIRKAIAILSQQGLLDVAQGKGTFVKNTVLHENLTRLTGIENIISESHLSSDISVLTFEVIDTPAHFDTELRRGLGKKCLHIEMVHTMEGVKAAYAETFLPLKYGEYITKSDVEKYTIYQLYESKLNMSLGNGRQSIRADAASKRVAEVLDLCEGWPVLSISRRGFTSSGELVEYMNLTYEYTQYSLEVELQLSST